MVNTKMPLQVSPNKLLSIEPELQKLIGLGFLFEYLMLFHFCYSKNSAVLTTLAHHLVCWLGFWSSTYFTLNVECKMPYKWLLDAIRTYMMYLMVQYILTHNNVLEDNIRDRWAKKRPQDDFSRANGSHSST